MAFTSSICLYCIDKRHIYIVINHADCGLCCCVDNQTLEQESVLSSPVACNLLNGVFPISLTIVSYKRDVAYSENICGFD